MTWVAVEDGLPEDAGKCLIILTNPNHDYYDIDFGSYSNKSWGIGHGSLIDNEFVTHWMPLPDLPKEK